MVNEKVDWPDWIGRQTVREDVASPRLLAEYRATLGHWLFETGGGTRCPPGFHWGLAPPMPSLDETGADGSEAKGIFLPPIAQPRRMWAGGMIETLAPIAPSDAVRRTSTISAIKTRTGKSGVLCFVSIVHEVEAQGALAVRERQDLVFREAGAALASAVPEQQPEGHLQWRVNATPALLFRFSAFTFNGHRIHYDRPYALSEGYGGLVVHGPLQAALMLNQAAAVLGTVPAAFEYRCMAPLCDGEIFSVSSKQEGASAASRIIRHDGVTTAEGRVHAPGT